MEKKCIEDALKKPKALRPKLNIPKGPKPHGGHLDQVLQGKPSMMRKEVSLGKALKSFPNRKV